MKDVNQMTEKAQKKKDLAALLEEFYELEIKLTPNQKSLAELKINEPTVSLATHYKTAGYSCDLNTAAGKKIAYINAYKILVNNEHVKRYGAILNYLASDEKIAKVEETQKILTAVIRGETTGYDVKVVRDGGGKDKVVETEVKPSIKERIAAARVLLKSQGAFVTKVEAIGSGTVQYIIKAATPAEIKAEEEKDD